VTIVAVWLNPRPVGDLFIALAGGEDVAAGRLTRPDTWSFVTQGACWINQNWGSGFILYLVNRGFGYAGLLILKFALISGCAFFIILLMRSRQIPHVLSVVLASLCLLGISRYLDLRPNLFSLLIVPLFVWIIFISREKPGLLWWSIPAEAIWANVHGGFVLGLALLLAWAAASLLASICDRRKVINKSTITAIVVFMAACMVACLSPFGLTNLVFPFDMLKPTIWKGVREWRPIWIPEKDPVSIYVFIGFLLTLHSLLFARFVHYGCPRGNRIEKAAENGGKEQSLRMLIFDILVVAASTTMAVSSKRFIPLSTLLMLPVWGGQIRWAISLAKWRAFPWYANGLALVALAAMIPDHFRYYSAPEPNATQSTFFEKMHRVNFRFPADLAAFVNANSISGNMLNFWDWEGFLRWKCPRIKVFVGGRAQQVYTEEACMTYLDLLYGKCDIGKLEEYGIRLIALPTIGKEYRRIVEKAVNEKSWIVIYEDAISILLIDYRWAPFQSIVGKAIEKKLLFPNAFAQTKSIEIWNSCLKYKTDIVCPK